MESLRLVNTMATTTAAAAAAAAAAATTTGIGRRKCTIHTAHAEGVLLACLTVRGIPRIW